MTYRPVVDHVAIPAYLDPLSAVLFTASFIAALLLTLRRPAYGLAAMILVTPLAFAHQLASTSVTLPKCVLLGVLAGLTGRPGWLAALRKSPAPLLLGVLAAYILATALSAPGAAYPEAAIRETLKWVQYAALFVAALACRAVDPDDAPPIAAIGIAAILVSLSALAQEIAGAPSGLYVGGAIVPRIAGLLEGPNQLSAYCTIAIATLGAWSLERRAPWLAAALALAVFADELTFSRAGIVALVVVAGVLALRGGATTWRALRPALAGAAAGALGALWWVIYAHTPGVLRVSLQPSLYAGGVGNRNQLWSAAWRMFRDRPIAGVGAGNFELELARYGVFGVRTHANSWYLQSLAEGGLMLFAATLAIVGASVAAFVRTPFVRSLRARSPWVVAALAASVALALHQVVDDFVFFPKVGDAWWLLLGIAAAA